MEKIEPMLASKFSGDLENFDNSDYIVENKWDGTRLIVDTTGDSVKAYTRNGKDRTEDVWYVIKDLQDVDGCIFDGEFVFLDNKGVSQFKPIHTSKSKILEEGLVPKYKVFDLIASNGESIKRKPLEKRKSKLSRKLYFLDDDDRVEKAEYQKGGGDKDFGEIFSKVREEGREGLILKKLDSIYKEDNRGRSWQKIKDFKETEVRVFGVQEGDNRLIGALLVRSKEGSYLGKVGTGFSSEDEMERVKNNLIEADERILSEKKIGEEYTPVEEFLIDVKYQEITNSGKLRSPVFLKIREDK